jgi:UDP-N-acetyl-D-mannosaminuronic acid transferase (WecB/TagA/CpsF family)
MGRQSKPQRLHGRIRGCGGDAQRPERPALLVTDLGERGRWMVVFSTLERLAAHSGECDYFATTGADLLELVPTGIGLMVDPDDDHRFPIVSRVAPPDVVARVWARAGGRRRHEQSATA